MPRHLSADCQDMLRRVMETNPDNRLTTAQIKTHKWFTETHTPICYIQGLLIGKNEIPIEPAMLKHLEQFQFTAEFAMQSLNANKHNQVTTTYYLLHRKYEKEGKLPGGFKVHSTPQKRESTPSIT